MVDVTLDALSDETHPAAIWISQLRDVVDESEI